MAEAPLTAKRRIEGRIVLSALLVATRAIPFRAPQ
jgi:hypothetical protein